MKAVERWSRGLDATSEAMFVADEDGRIRYWNEGAQRLLGYARDEVLGKRCFSVLGGCHAGRHWCEADCRVRRTVRRGTLPPQVSLELRSKDGRRVPVGVTFIVQKAEGRKAIAHLLQDTSRQDELRETLRGVLRLLQGMGDSRCGAAVPNECVSTPASGRGEAGGLSALTRRQAEVLRLLTRGLSTESIAEQLGVSPFTARNHIQSTLQQMGLHTRTQAVAAALEQGLR